MSAPRVTGGRGAPEAGRLIPGRRAGPHYRRLFRLADPREEVGLRGMRVFAAWRSVVSLTVAILLLWGLAQRRLIETHTLLDAAGNAPGTLLVLGILLLAPLVVGSVRYQAVLQAMAKHVPVSPILAANAVSSAVAIWLPA